MIERVQETLSRSVIMIGWPFERRRVLGPPDFGASFSAAPPQEATALFLLEADAPDGCHEDAAADERECVGEGIHGVGLFRAVRGWSQYRAAASRGDSSAGGSS